MLNKIKTRITMIYKEKLIELYNEAKKSKSYSKELNRNTKENLNILSKNCDTQKGLYTVFVTLCIYKIIHPSQDIRNHQTQLPNGFF